ncbi:ATP-binding protein [Agromyces protaetiae]|uniref:ATP-binding protein n=1 Tax=Agromyces protaetiae TaxID=2509455 RepID=A0A4P6FC05_9MICO|nr:ATP-binding protein [Agromyces protaetiae]QAY73830.1 ATP-binding protein [Agromyces protaetiae]
MTLTTAAAVAAARRVLADGSAAPRIVAVDGPSGAGKSTFADALLAALPAQRLRLVRLDDVYPGWSGLEQGAALAAHHAVEPWSRGRPATTPRWDWAANAPDGRDRMPPGGVLLVEGCGAFAAVAGEVALRVWMTAGDRERKAAALARDEGRFDPFWEMWDGQWRRYAARNGASARSADFVVHAHSPSRPHRG